MAKSGCIGTYYLRGIKDELLLGCNSDFHAFRRLSDRLYYGYCFIALQVSAGRVYDSVLLAAEGIKKAMKKGAVLPNTRRYRGFCSSSETQQENTSGKELARHLNEVTGC